MRRSCILLLSILTIAVCTTGCPEEKEEKEDESPESLSISPLDPQVAVGSSLQLTATAHFADGSTLDVTELATWASADVTVATVDDEGVVLTLTTGEADISASYDLRIAETELTIVVPPPPPFFESELNDDAASADNFTGAAAFEGTCDFTTDEYDYFTAIVPPGTLTATITWVEGAFPQDLDIYLLDADELEITSDADVPPGDTPATVTANLASASNTVFVVVDCFDTDAATDYSGALSHP